MQTFTHTYIEHVPTNLTLTGKNEQLKKKNNTEQGNRISVRLVFRTTLSTAKSTRKITTNICQIIALFLWFFFRKSITCDTTEK